MYDPTLGRFTSADTVIPDGVQGLDRYAYVNNSPIRYIDPSGHDAWWCETASCSYNYYHHSNYSATGELDYIKARTLQDYGVTLADGGAGERKLKSMKNSQGLNWNLANAQVIDSGLSTMNKALNGNLHKIIGSVTFTLNTHTDQKGDLDSMYLGWTTPNAVDFYNNFPIRLQNLYHESGHVLDNSAGDAFSHADGINNKAFLDKDGRLDYAALINKSHDMYQHNLSIYTDDMVSAQNEHWADMFANYVAGNINLAETEGQAMNTFVTGALAPYIGTP